MGPSSAANDSYVKEAPSRVEHQDGPGKTGRQKISRSPASHHAVRVTCVVRTGGRETKVVFVCNDQTRTSLSLLYGKHD